MMNVVKLDLANPAPMPKLALTIGNYDGVHLGHQAMLSALVRCAKQEQLATAVMVFEKQPREFFCADNPPPRLTNLAEKSALLATLGVDYLLVATFDDEFCSLTAQDFAQLLKNLNVHQLVLGDDFRFGKDRLGDSEFLRQAGFGVFNLPTVQDAGERISSTAVREALARCDLARAKQLLGRDYRMMGEVVHGDKIGRTLNFATANVAIQRLKPAMTGIFGADIFAYKDGQRLDWSSLGAGGVQGVAEGSLFGAVNLGKRPSVHGQEYRLEVHLPTFVGDLYGITLEVVFLVYLHGEQKYASLDELKAGIAKDVADLLAWRASKNAP